MMVLALGLVPRVASGVGICEGQGAGSNSWCME